MHAKPTPNAATKPALHKHEDGTGSPVRRDAAEQPSDGAPPPSPAPPPNPAQPPSPAQPNDPAQPARPSLGRLVLGAATLAGERMRMLAEPQAPALALVVGLASEGRDAAARAAERVVDGARQAVPAERIRQIIDDASARGREAVISSRDQTAQWLANTAGGPMRWAEQTLIPRVVDDMRPYVANTLAPQLIDDVMPQIRTRVVPAIIEDLAANPRVRAMVTEQSHGAVAAATGDLREAAADADDRVEAAFRSAFRRGART